MPPPRSKRRFDPAADPAFRRDANAFARNGSSASVAVKQDRRQRIRRLWRRSWAPGTRAAEGPAEATWKSQRHAAYGVAAASAGKRSFQTRFAEGRLSSHSAAITHNAKSQKYPPQSR